MLIIREKQLREQVHRIFDEFIDDALVKLDPEKYYILVLPETISVEQSQKYLKRLTDRTNLAVIHADNVRIVELSR